MIRKTPTVELGFELLTGHDAPVVTAAFSPDGTLLATGSYDQTVIVWDIPSGAMRHRLWGHRESLITVAFSPSGERLASNVLRAQERSESS